jgi:hypothetical protein
LKIYETKASSLPIDEIETDRKFDFGLMFTTDNIFESLDKMPLKINLSPDGIPYYFIYLFIYVYATRT